MHFLGWIWPHVFPNSFQAEYIYAHFHHYILKPSCQCDAYLASSHTSAFPAHILDMSAQSRKRNGHDGVHGQVASAGYCLHVDKSNGSDSTTPLLAAGDDDCECVCSSWVDARKSSQQTATERDAEESRGRGTYSLHAVLGQGSFGRIHLASWRGNDYASDVVRDTPAARPRDFLTSSKRRPDSRNERYANDNNLASFGELHTSLTSFLTGQAQHRHVDDAGAGASSATSASRTLPRGSLKMEEFGARFSSQGRSYIRQRQPSPRHPENPSFHRPTPKILEPFGAGDEAAERSRPLDVGEGCEAGIVLEDTGEVADTGDPIRLRALKSVCKRKVTEKGLIHHMETVRKGSTCFLRTIALCLCRAGFGQHRHGIFKTFVINCRNV